MPAPWEQYAKQPSDVQANAGAPWQRYAPPALTGRPAGLPEGVELPAIGRPKVEMSPSILGRDAAPSAFDTSVSNLAKGAVKGGLHTIVGLSDIVYPEGREGPNSVVND